MSNFNFSVLTLSGTIFEGDVNKVIVTTSEGEITILKNHIPLITTTNNGRLIIFKEDQKLEYIANTGVLKINKEKVILMSDKIQKLE